MDWDRFLGSAPKRPFEPIRLFRWRNYQDYGTGVAGDLFVHLFSGLHCITGALGPTRVYATGGLRYWKDGRDVPDVMLGLYDYPKTDKHPEFTLSLQVNFADGSGGEEGFRFVGLRGHPDAWAATASPSPAAARRRSPATRSTPSPRSCRTSSSRTTAQKYPERSREVND